MLFHHCSNFRAWTSVSSNSWITQEQGGLSSVSNSSQPSWLHPSNPDTWSPSLSGPDGISPPACNSLNPGSQETSPYEKIGSASWRSCCSPGFWKQSACCWQILHSFWTYRCQESSSLPEQMPSTLPVPLCSVSFWTLDLWAAISEDCQRCQLSTSPWSILEKPGTSQWSSHHLCPEPWWTAWLSQAWCAAVGRVFFLCPPEGCWWCSFLCKAPIPPAKASPPSCNAEHGPYYHSYTENMGTDPFLT